MRRISWLTLSVALLAGAAQAQLTPTDPDWKEVEAPPPAALRTDKLLRIEIPESTLAFGVIPESVVLSKDGIVRYVVVATSSSGAVNAFYEGIRCTEGQGKVYARHSPDSGWVPAKGSEWRSLYDSAFMHHSLVIARTGVCMGRSPNVSAEQIVRDLGRGPDRRFYIN